MMANAERRRSRATVRVAIALAAMLLGGAAASAPVTVGGPFTLTDGDGTVVTEARFRGKWLLVYFGFTHCPVACPTALLEVADALHRLGDAAAAVQPLFITVDPERDTAATLRDYVGSFDPRIVGLTGTAEQIDRVARAYGVVYEAHRRGPDDRDYVVDHSTYIYLMDPAGNFVRGFDAEATGADIAAALRARMGSRPATTVP